jgi:hypothetical protein
MEFAAHYVSRKTAFSRAPLLRQNPNRHPPPHAASHLRSAAQVSARAAFVPQPTTVLSAHDSVSTVLLPALLPDATIKIVRRVAHRRLREVNAMKSVYAAWMGQPVVMQLASDDLRVPLRGTVVGESDAVVRFRLGDGLDVDIYKKMILAIEEDTFAGLLITKD